MNYTSLSSGPVRPRFFTSKDPNFLTKEYSFQNSKVNTPNIESTHSPNFRNNRNSHTINPASPKIRK